MKERLMEKLQALVSLLEELASISDAIIRKSVPVMKIVLNDQKGCIEKLRSRYPGVDDAVLKERLQGSSLDLIIDAKTVKRELNDFIEVAVLGEKTWFDVKAPFLQLVWLGDSYGGCDKICGLEELLKDLKGQLEECCIEKVLEKC